MNVELYVDKELKRNRKFQAVKRVGRKAGWERELHVELVTTKESGNGVVP